MPRFIADGLYDSLLQINPNDGSLRPGLATSWQVSDDARTFTFRLRSGVKWHDGQPLRAQDVVFTIKALSAPDLRMTPAADFGPIGDVSAPDAQTVIVRMTEAYCPALANVGTLKILPEHVFSVPGASPTGSTSPATLTSLLPEQLVGTGPLELKAWDTGAITFVSNADYWDGSPLIAIWNYKFFPTTADALAALNAGQLDLLALDLGTQRASLSASSVSVYSHPANMFYALAINQEGTLLSDSRIAKALAYSLDRPKLASELFGGDAISLQTSVLPHFWASAADATQPDYGPARARQLLTEAGWSDTDANGVLDKNGKPLSVTLWAIAGDPIDEPLAYSVRQMLSQVGIQVLLELDDRAEFLSRLFSHEFDLAIAPWNIPLDPDQHWYWQSTENKPGAGLNFLSYSNSHVDDLLERGNASKGCDPGVRRGIYAETYRSIAADVPEVFLFAPPVYVAARSTLKGLDPSSFAGEYWNLNSWRMTP